MPPTVTIVFVEPFAPPDFTPIVRQIKAEMEAQTTRAIDGLKTELTEMINKKRRAKDDASS